MILDDHFERAPLPYWVRFATGHADLEHEPGIMRLVLEGAVKGLLSDAEIDDHRTMPRARLPWKSPLTMKIRARMSHPSGELLGTAGFGFWNDPFDWVGNVQVPPNALWYFYASPPSDMAFVPGVRGNGWKAAMLNGGSADRLTMAAGNFVFGLPGMSKLVFALAQTRINASETLLDSVSITEWHDYTLEWLTDRAVFSVDGKEVMNSANPSRGPLGFVAWVDNNMAIMGPGRDFSFERLAISQRQWMELASVSIAQL